MSQVKKTLDRWDNNPPQSVPREKVFAILKRYFPGQYEQKGGSHIIVQDDKLIGLPGYGPDGDFSIPVRGGQQVLGCYLKRLAKTVRLLEGDEK